MNEPKILCGHCFSYHYTVAQVRVCGIKIYIDPETGEQREAWPCTWLLQEWVIDGYHTWECAHPTWALPGDLGTTCAAGHTHYSLEAQERLGIVYATEDEAASLHRAGKTVLMMDGHNYVPV